MATPRIGTKLAIEGEKEYKQAISEINSGLKELNSEMKLTTKQFEDNSDSMDAMSKVSDVLERQILSQKEKIAMLEEALKHAARAFGESDTRTIDWRTSLNNTNAELLDLERQLQDTEAAMEDCSEATEDGGKEFKSLGDVAEDLADRLGLKLPDGAKKALDAFSKIDAKTAAVAVGLAATAAAIAKVEETLIDLTTEAAQSATELEQMAAMVNLDVEAAQKWDYVLKSVGSSLESAQGDLSNFQEKILEATMGEGEAYDVFTMLNIALEDQSGHLRSMEDVLLDTIQTLTEMDDITTRNAASSMLLNTTGEKLIPLYNRQTGAVEDLMREKERLGIMTQKEIDALGDVTASLRTYQEQTTAAKNTIAAEFAPALSDFYETAGNGIATLGQAAADSGLVEFFAFILELVTALEPAIDILADTMNALAPVFDVLAVALGAVGDAINIVLSGISGIIDYWRGDEAGMMEDTYRIADILSGKTSKTAEAWRNASWNETIATATSNLTTNRLPGYANSTWNASGSWNFSGGYTWVGENGPELVELPRGSRIYNAQESRNIGGDTFYVNIDAKNVKEFNDIVETARAHRRRTRMEGTS